MNEQPTPLPVILTDSEADKLFGGKPAPTKAATPAPLILTSTQAAELLGVSRETLRQWYAAGVIPRETAFRVGRLVKFRRLALEEFARGGKMAANGNRFPRR